MSNSKTHIFEAMESTSNHNDLLTSKRFYIDGPISDSIYLQESYTLLLVVDDDELRKAYEESLSKRLPGDLGLDIPMPEEVQVFRSVVDYGARATYIPQIFELGIRAAMYRVGENGYMQRIGYQIVPRSSIYKTPLSLANSVGIIDHYNGILKAPFRSMINYKIKKHQRLLQIVGFTGVPFTVQFVDSLERSTRGEGGFGSTGF